MSDTRMDDPLELSPHRVRGYQLLNGQLRNSEFIDVSSRFAAGGARGTVSDLLRFMLALNNGKLLGQKSIDIILMTRFVSLFCPILDLKVLQSAKRAIVGYQNGFDS